METVLDKFLRYVKIETTSDESSETFPSTPTQKPFLKMLADELTQMGIAAKQDEYGYVYAKIPKNIKTARAKIAFIAHADTSPAVSGKNVNPRVVTFTGKDIPLDEKGTMRLSSVEYPEMNDYTGQDLVVTDGSTLLGADDKAGVAEIMFLAQYLSAHPDIEHGDILIAFTPDEEVGRGVDFFDVKRLGADYGYTVDGGKLGEIEYENFNAAAAKLKVNGVSIHPGTAKGRMKNAVELAMEFNGMLPAAEKPYTTEGYEGFYHLNDMKGDVEYAELSYIIRDHSKAHFEARKQFFVDTADYLNKKYGQNTFEYKITDSYYNMREIIEKNMHLVENAAKAMQECGVEPLIQPIRGGTDGARLSFMGLPCPNLSAGGHNFHGRYEYVPVKSMEKMTEVLLEIVKLYARK